MLCWSGKAVVQNVLAIAPCCAVNQSSHLSAYHFPKLPYTMCTKDMLVIRFVRYGCLNLVTYSRSTSDKYTGIIEKQEVKM